MIILGIESSCDDTSVALLSVDEQRTKILSEKTASQIEVHKKYGGVVPEIAGRCHAENILPLIEAVLENQPKPDVIAITSGPGLITGLLVGVEAGKTMSYLLNIPLAKINHIEGHIYSALISKKEIKFPAVCLIASGGHTELILMKNHGEYELIGRTLDDAAGECFDKVGKLIGLEYPGGPKISKLALKGNPQAIVFPRPMLKENNLEFSFAGLKTSALYWLKNNKLSAMKFSPIRLVAGIWGQQPEPPTKEDFCASLEQAIIDVLVGKTIIAAKKYKPETIILAGGVSANQKLRQTLSDAVKELKGCDFLVPKQQYAMDNATMIAMAGYFHAKQNHLVKWGDIQADPNWKLVS